MAPHIQNVPADRFDDLIRRIPLREQQEKWRSAREGFARADIDNAMRKVEIAIDKAEAQLGVTQWLAGDQFTLADINYFADCGLALGFLFGDIATPARCPRLLHWVERIKERPSMKRILD